MSENGKGPRFKRMVETQMIIDRLLDLGKGNSVPIEELCNLIGDPHLYQKRRYILQSARYIVEDLGGINIEWKDGMLRVLTDEETAKTGYVRKLRRTTDRCIVRSSRISDFDALSDDDKVKITCSRTVMAMIKANTAHESIKKLESKIKESTVKLDLDTQLKAFLE